MRPLGFLLAILTGSTVALSVGLLLTWVVILFLPENEAQFAPEHGPLLRAIAVFSLFAATAAVSLYGEMANRTRPARKPFRSARRHRWAHLVDLIHLLPGQDPVELRAGSGGGQLVDLFLGQVHPIQHERWHSVLTQGAHSLVKVG